MTATVGNTDIFMDFQFFLLRLKTFPFVNMLVLAQLSIGPIANKLANFLSS